jgi:hypothetical protein
MGFKMVFLRLTLICGALITGSVPLSLSQAGNTLPWVETNNYAEYNVTMEVIIENTEIMENVNYSGSGTVRWTVKEITENYATVEISRELTWKDNKIPPGFPTGTVEENWYYYVSISIFTLSQHELESLKTENVPKRLEGIYQGIKETKVPCGDFKTFHISENENETHMTRDMNAYYDTNAGILVKRTLESEYKFPDGPYIYNRINHELQNTNISTEKVLPEPPSPETPWQWIAIGVIIVAVIIIIMLRRRTSPSFGRN